MKLKKLFQKCSDEQTVSVYDEVMHRIDGILARCTETEDKLIIINYLISNMLQEICAETRIKSLKETVATTRYPFPGTYNTGKRVYVNLAETNVYAHNYNFRNIPNTMKKIEKEGFIYNAGGHNAVHYSGINLTCVTDGRHSVSIGNYLGQGTIEAIDMPINIICQKYKTDGMVWIQVDSGNIEPVEDYRWAIIFSLAKFKLEME